MPKPRKIHSNITGKGLIKRMTGKTSAKRKINSNITGKGLIKRLSK
jgi:hypothetical protein